MLPYSCPSCKHTDVIDYGETIECPICQQEFSKHDLDQYPEDKVLSIKEKRGFLKPFNK